MQEIASADITVIDSEEGTLKPRNMVGTVELIFEAPLGTGEGPHWIPEENSLVFVDIPGHTVFKYDAATNTVKRAIYDGAGNVSFIIPVANNPGKYLIGADLRVSLLEWNDDGLKVTDIAETVEHEGNRFNDAKCDRSGRLWAGTMGYVENGVIADNLSNLYTLVGQNLEVKVPEVSLSNGLAWSADDKTFYYVDTKTQRIDAFDYDIAEGAITNRRTIFDLPSNGYNSSPDGMTIDVEGNLWLALYGGNGILHINPNTGEVLDTIELPVPNVTSCTWGGENLDELYVTSAAGGADMTTFPLSGSLFKVTGLGTKGYPNVQANFQLPASKE